MSIHLAKTLDVHGRRSRVLQRGLRNATAVDQPQRDQDLPEATSERGDHPALLPRH